MRVFLKPTASWKPCSDGHLRMQRNAALQGVLALILAIASPYWNSHIGAFMDQTCRVSNLTNKDCSARLGPRWRRWAEHRGRLPSVIKNRNHEFNCGLPDEFGQNVNFAWQKGLLGGREATRSYGMMTCAKAQAQGVKQFNSRAEEDAGNRW